MASEDFSYMLDKCPGAYINIGNKGGGSDCEVHNPGYDFNDGILALGASYYARLIERRLAKGENPEG
jgi:hippurate hydrolase